MDIGHNGFPPNALPFTADAHSMYTNIKTDPALSSITHHIRNKVRMSENKKEALIEAMNIVFRTNLFKFGDTYWLQKSGTAMGTPPAPPYATIFYALHEKMKCSHNGRNRSHFINISLMTSLAFGSHIQIQCRINFFGRNSALIWTNGMDFAGSVKLLRLL
eukprot:scaffold112213_cov44-Cyclotella_meneghiniana.AAC.1